MKTLLAALFCLACVALVAERGFAGAAPDQPAPMLSVMATGLAGEPVEVRCAPSLAFLGTASGPVVRLRADLCRALRAAPRWDAIIGMAVNTLAHEVGHVRVAGVDDELDAECFAAGHLTETAYLLGFRRALLRRVVAAARSTNRCDDVATTTGELLCLPVCGPAGSR